MRRSILQMSLVLALAFCWIVATSPALAEKPSWAGGGKGGEKHKPKEGGEKQKGKKDRDDGESDEKPGPGAKTGEHFGKQNRKAIDDYYAGQFRTGRCPPGLAKKGNGCMPPGQAKKWQVGRPLPREVVFYDLPPEILGYLGPAPSRHRYVRVAKDILLIATGTGMVVDAIEDIGREISR
jgi:hypothetical protein